MLLHAHTTVFVWMGLCAHPPHHRVAMHTPHTHGVARRGAAPPPAHHHHTPSRVATRLWCGTKHRRCATTAARVPRQHGVRRGHGAPPHAQVLVRTPGRKQPNPPRGLDEAALESCHDDAVFEQVFGMVGDAFGRLAMWHTPNHNHKHRLCHHTPPPWHNTTPPHTPPAATHCCGT